MKAPPGHVTPASDEAQAAGVALGSKDQTKNYSPDFLCAAPKLQGGCKRMAARKTARHAAQCSSLRARIKAFSAGIARVTASGDLVLAERYAAAMVLWVKRLADLGEVL